MYDVIENIYMLISCLEIHMYAVENPHRIFYDRQPDMRSVGLLIMQLMYCYYTKH